MFDSLSCGCLQGLSASSYSYEGSTFVNKLAQLCPRVKECTLTDSSMQLGRDSALRGLSRFQFLETLVLGSSSLPALRGSNFANLKRLQVKTLHTAKIGDLDGVPSLQQIDIEHCYIRDSSSDYSRLLAAAAGHASLTCIKVNTVHILGFACHATVKEVFDFLGMPPFYWAGDLNASHMSNRGRLLCIAGVLASSHLAAQVRKLELCWGLAAQSELAACLSQVFNGVNRLAVSCSSMDPITDADSVGRLVGSWKALEGLALLCFTFPTLSDSHAECVMQGFQRLVQPLQDMRATGLLGLAQQKLDLKLSMIKKHCGPGNVTYSESSFSA